MRQAVAVAETRDGDDDFLRNFSCFSAEEVNEYVDEWQLEEIIDLRNRVKETWHKERACEWLELEAVARLWQGVGRLNAIIGSLTSSWPK